MSCSVLISTCDKYSDLWDMHMKLYSDFWQDNPYDTYLVTDKVTNRTFTGVKVLAEGEDKDFPLRIHLALDAITTKYVLLTCEEYFLTDKVDTSGIEELIEIMREKELDYVSLYNRRRTKKKHKRPVCELSALDLYSKYALTLYPAIWSVEFLKKTCKEDTTPWLYEPSLTETALREHANCARSDAQLYKILDVVRKGCIQHSANRYFKKHHISVGDRPILDWKIEIKLFIMDRIYWYAPKPVFKMLKNTAKRFGMKFYSED